MSFEVITFKMPEIIDLSISDVDVNNNYSMYPLYVLTHYI